MALVVLVLLACLSHHQYSSVFDFLQSACCRYLVCEVSHMQVCAENLELCLERSPLWVVAVLRVRYPPGRYASASLPISLATARSTDLAAWMISRADLLTDDTAEVTLWNVCAFTTL